MIFDDSIPKGINIGNLNTRLSTANWKGRFFDSATSKHFNHYIQPTLNEKSVKTDIAILHMEKNDILNAEIDKDLSSVQLMTFFKINVQHIQFHIIAPLEIWLSSKSVR